MNMNMNDLYIVSLVWIDFDGNTNPEIHTSVYRKIQDVDEDIDRLVDSLWYNGYKTTPFNKRRIARIFNAEDFEVGYISITENKYINLR